MRSRSEERAMIVAAVLLLLWGTLITEPLHICTDFFWRGCLKAVSILKLSEHIKTQTILTTILFSIIFVGLMYLSGKGIYRYIPVFYFSLCSLYLILRFFVKRQFDIRAIAGLAAGLAVTLILHLIRSDKLLKWEADLCILSGSAFLLTGYVFKPLIRRADILSKIFYIARYQQVDTGSAFGGFLSIPAEVWGGFIFAIVTLPMAFYSVSRDKEPL